MTIRLLAAYGPYACNAIVTLDAATEAGLVAAGQATTNLAGGMASAVGVAQAASMRQTFVIGALNAPVTAPTDTLENTLYSLNIPGGMLGPNDTLRVTARCSCVNSANTKNFKIKHGPNTVMALAVSTSPGCNIVLLLCNKGVLNSQGVGSVVNGSTGSNASYSVDTMQDHVISLSVTKSLGAEAVVLESILIELLCGGVQ